MRRRRRGAARSRTNRCGSFGSDRAGRRSAGRWPPWSRQRGDTVAAVDTRVRVAPSSGTERAGQSPRPRKAKHCGQRQAWQQGTPADDGPCVQVRQPNEQPGRTPADRRSTTMTKPIHRRDTYIPVRTLKPAGLRRQQWIEASLPAKWCFARPVLCLPVSVGRCVRSCPRQFPSTCFAQPAMQVVQPSVP